MYTFILIIQWLFHFINKLRFTNANLAIKNLLILIRVYSIMYPFYLGSDYLGGGIGIKCKQEWDSVESKYPTWHF